MASKQSLDALSAADKALVDVHTHLQPLFTMMVAPKSTPRQRGVAQTAIALSLGTVRFLSSKLLVRNKAVAAAAASSEHPPQLRQELNQMRKLLAAIQQSKGTPTTTTKKKKLLSTMNRDNEEGNETKDNVEDNIAAVQVKRKTDQVHDTEREIDSSNKRARKSSDLS
jgi:hypothetical protein